MKFIVRCLAAACLFVILTNGYSLRTIDAWMRAVQPAAYDQIPDATLGLPVVVHARVWMPPPYESESIRSSYSYGNKNHNDEWHQGKAGDYNQSL